MAQQDTLSMSPKERHFVREFVKDFDGPAAAQRAGYSRRSSARLLKHPGVKAMVTRNQARLNAASLVDQRKIVERLALIAFGDIRDVMTWRTDLDDGTTEIILKDSDDLSPEHALLINEVKVDKDGNAQVKLQDRSSALDKLARHLGMYNDAVGVEFTGELADMLKGAINNGHTLPSPVRHDDSDGGVVEGIARPAVPRPQLPTPIRESRGET